MITSAARAILCGGAAGALLVIGACSSTDQAPVGSNDDAGSSTSPVPPPPASDDAGIDAGADAAADASVDAQARTCSGDHFCHSVLPANQALRGVWSDGTGITWAVSKGGSILRWDGSAWIVHAKGLDELRAIWGSGPTDIWVAGKQGLFHGVGATPSALVFSPVANLPGDPAHVISSIWGTGPNDVWAVGGLVTDFDSAGRVLHYAGPSPTADGGSDWTLDDVSSEPLAFGTVWGTPDGGVWIQGGTPLFGIAGVYQRKIGSTTWDLVTLPPDPHGNFAPDPGLFTAAGSSSASSTWLVGRTGEFIDGYWHGTSADNGMTFTWTFAQRPFGSLGLNAIWGVGVNDTWGVGPSGRVAHWNGTKWAQAAILVTALPVTKSFYGIWGKSNDDFWVVGDDIALHRTTGNTP